ncbi:hypothetical protein [Halovivax limisalsi]|uniref:hypothetical protein n=1 Tax=Halovivax limisalsi TaxID=1453760 RepID=UPI001FFD0632|nr:hypothetical protein [Halovivax limisalsi]
MTDRTHGEWDERQVQRWCAECETWVLSVDWMAHYEHGPTETADSKSPAGTNAASESKSGPADESEWESGSDAGSSSAAESGERAGECPPNP